ncbi:MAG: polymer-forming cytoskeletal protein [Rhodospirillales bacterium]|jgi:cytoskeletal protein CcmA (bactofilin family)|nr:polymer-forming cytoskeletal protein [Rhodospirillales bacterium]
MFFRSSPSTRSRAATAAGGKRVIPSLLGTDLRITGDIASSGEVQVDGQVEGDIIADCLIVSETGVVDGSVAANSVRVLGTVNGPITAGSVKLGRSARVTGDIVHRALSVEEGAFVSGHCRRSDVAGRAEDAEDEDGLGGGGKDEPAAAAADPDQASTGAPGAVSGRGRSPAPRCRR